MWTILSRSNGRTFLRRESSGCVVKAQCGFLDDTPDSTWREVEIRASDFVTLTAWVGHEFKGDADATADDLAMRLSVLAGRLTRDAEIEAEVDRDMPALAAMAQKAAKHPFRTLQDVSEAAARVCEDPRGH